MRQLVIKIAAFILFIFLFTLLAMAILPDDEGNYVAAIKDKHARLGSLPSPKLILAGGSNVAFGIDSELMQEKLGMPVINMGLSVNIGLDYILNELKPDIKPGDIVVLMPEYELMFSDAGPGEKREFRKLLEVFPQATQFVAPGVLLRYSLHAYVDALQNKLKRFFLKSESQNHPHVIRNMQVYRRASFNKFGDVTAHLPLGNQGFLEYDSLPAYAGEPVQPAFYEALKGFSEFVKDKGATLLYSFPPTPKRYADQEVGLYIYENLQQKLDIPLLDTPASQVYADSLFFDTRYHLISSSRRQRTLKLIDNITKKMR